MRRPRSFRARLAVRFAGIVVVLAVAAAAAGYVALRHILLEQLDRTLVRLASIEASATSDTPDQSVHFHDQVFTGGGAGHRTILPRYAEIWTVEGAPVLRTRSLGGRDLPLPAEVRRRVSRDMAPALFTVRLAGQRQRSLLYPLGLVGPRHRLHLLQVAVSTRSADEALARLIRVLLVLVLAGAAAAGLVGWWVAGRAVGPVLETVRQAEVLDVGSEAHRITARPDTEEIDRLVRVLNGLLDRAHDTLASQRRFLAEAGHEIRTPLTVLRGDVEVALRRRREPDEYRETLRQVLADLRRVSGLADDLLTLARSESGALEPVLEPVDAGELARRMAGRLETAARDAGVELRTRIGDGSTIRADSALLERALANLVDNAIKYSPAGGSVCVRVAVRRPPGTGPGAGAAGAPRPEVVIGVADRGPGIAPEERERVFDPFFRGRAARAATAGSGLGLAIVQAIVDRHGGTVRLSGREGGGTVAEIRLPVASP